MARDAVQSLATMTIAPIPPLRQLALPLAIHALAQALTVSPVSVDTISTRIHASRAAQPLRVALPAPIPRIALFARTDQVEPLAPHAVLPNT